MSENFDGNGRSIGWKTWDLIRQPKQKWVTGFRKFKEFNQAIIAKLGWMVFFDQDILCFKC